MSGWQGDPPQSPTRGNSELTSQPRFYDVLIFSALDICRHIPFAIAFASFQRFLTGFDLATRDSYFTILAEVFTNHF